MQPVALSPQARQDALDALGSGRELDVLVVGGGVVGAGCALDAVTRGLTVGLVESRDWASGTSSRSSKLIHGGLRYLEMLDFRLVREALQERGLLIQRLAPHLVRPVPFLYPLTRRFVERPYVGAGVLLYDTMGLTSGTSRGLPLHRHLTRRQALHEVPALRRDALVGAVKYYDAQVDDARHTLTVVRTAAAYGAQVANRAKVAGFLRQGERVTGALVVDLESGREYRVHAKQVINATGVWTDDTQALAGTRGQFHVRASKGVHILVPRDRVNARSGLILRTEKSVLFVIPWGRHWLIGTTDTAWDLDKNHPAVSSRDIDYLLDHVNAVLATPLSRDDVEGVYAGLRPLLAGDAADTSKLSREHLVGHPVPGLVVIAGGKYTTYRVMAKDAVDEAVRVRDGHRPGPSVTHDIPLLGAEGYRALWNRRESLAAESGLHVARIEHFLQRYGSLIGEVLDLVAADPALAEPLPGSDDYLLAEAVYAVTHEGARHLDDVLTRRTRASIESWDRGLAAADPVARLMATPLGWDDEQIAHEIEHYRKRVEAELEAQRQPDDATADAARLGAPDIVPLH
ncbi:glycerol-3-phosphate dehydrogenase/oxidase [Kitasatospora sp. NPDC049285]|uniref:glycerol-3-phosphate dehydrogenase/oxidase n=1 Tax=Kitasatospora sp. NPDC049285 TaxID=3157096 RepID=UPI00342A71B7